MTTPTITTDPRTGITTCARCGRERTDTNRQRARQWARHHARGCSGRGKPLPPPPAPGVIRPWTAREEQLALTLPPAEAAELLGRTANAVRAKRRKMAAQGTRPSWRGGTPWTAEEDATLLPAAGPAEAHRNLTTDRTIAAVKGRLQRLKKKAS